ncbi:MAG: formylglycine-generating enzyme family protein [Deltaproteobacteria bacterium]|nr:formylglycine-generating enzyme family protein [Deltaproteobacteria bacterium]
MKQAYAIVLSCVCLAGCNGSSSGKDGGDGGFVFFGECPFPYSVPQKHTITDDRGMEHHPLDRHVRCQIKYEDLDAEVFIKAEPFKIEMQSTYYNVIAAYVCRAGQVDVLPEGMAEFGSIGRHSWKTMDVAIEGKRYVFSMSEICVGHRPCTPWPDQFDVRRLDDGSLITEGVLSMCAGVGDNGYPAPLVPQVRIPPEGEGVPFSMGSLDGDPDEQPPVTFDIYPVRMDVREASNSDFAAFLTDHGNDCDGHPCVDTQAESFQLEQTDGIWKPKEGYQDYPLVHVSWYGAASYCSWRRMLLPHEAAWEIAASGMGTRRYPWGDEDPTCDRALFDACSISAPGPVCSIPQGNSREEICDLSGNLAEWLAGWYLADFYATCGTMTYSCARSTYEDTGEKCVRGGSFLDPAHNLRATDRDRRQPSITAADLGLRCISGNPSF